MMRNFQLFTIILFATFISCKENPKPSAQYMTLDEVVYVDKFQNNDKLTDGQDVNLDILNPFSINIVDTILIVSNNNPDGLWSFYSLPSLTPLGKYLKKGQGPQEVLSSIYASQSQFFKTHGEQHAYLYDFQTGRLLDMNITETLKGKSLNISQTSDSLAPFLTTVVKLSGDRVLCKEIADNQTRQKRFLITNGISGSTDNLDKLNLATIRVGEDFNILSTSTRITPDENLIVEAPIGLNQLNVYSVDKPNGITICAGEELDNIDKIQDTERPDRMYTYMNAVTFNDFFGALYLNQPYKEYELKQVTPQVIQLFGYDGTPLAQIELNQHITSFDIDVINGELYTLNYNTEEIHKYNIRTLLDKIATKC